MNNNQLTIAQIIKAYERHKFKALLTWAAVIFVAAILFVLWPRQYGSEGRIYVQTGRNNSSLSPSTSTSVTVQDTRETEIRSVVEIIKSRAVIEAVVDDVGSDAILEHKWSHLIPSISLPSFSSGDGEMSIEEYNRLKKRELAARKLGKTMTVETEKKTSIVSVFVKARSAKLAQKIVNRIFDHTRRVHLSVHASKGSEVFFDEQFEDQQRELVKAVKKLAEFRNKNQVLSINGARGTLQGIITNLDSGLVNAQINRDEALKRKMELERLMSSTKERIELPTTGVERLSYEDSRTELFKLEAEKERLLATYERTHPEVVRVVAQLEKLESALEKMTQDRTENALSSNPVFEALKVDFLRARAELAAAEQKVKAIESKIEAAREELVDLNLAEVESDQLQRDVSVARQYLGIYTQKRGEAKALSSLDDRKISDIRIAQEANFNVKHVSPRGSLVMSLAFILGALASLGVVLFCERDQFMGTLNESEVEELLDLPVLVTIPRVYSSRSMVN